MPPQNHTRSVYILPVRTNPLSLSLLPELLLISGVIFLLLFHIHLSCNKQKVDLFCNLHFLQDLTSSLSAFPESVTTHQPPILIQDSCDIPETDPLGTRLVKI